MSLTLYEITCPVFIKNLEILSQLIKKASGFVLTGAITETELTSSRLIEDMGDFIFQIQRACIAAAFVPAFVGGAEHLSLPNDEVTLEEAQARIAKTIEYLRQVTPETIAGKDDAEVTLKLPSGDYKASARKYVMDWAIPNFWFHIVTGYALLRSKGVPLGKADFVGAAS